MSPQNKIESRKISNNNNNSPTKPFGPINRLITTSINKYPTDRDTPFKNAVNWLNARRLDDNLGDGRRPLWRVHNKLYDLTPFIHKHPGGSDWISMTIDTDVTEAFEASHILNYTQVQAILAKYYVCEASRPRSHAIYTFEPHGFYNVLKRKVEPILKKVGTGPTSSVIKIQDTLALTFFLLLWSSIVLDSLLGQIVTGLVLGMTIITAHNFFHIKDNWRKYYFDLSFLSSYEWRISHALSHHLYTNTIMDYEIYMLEPFFQVCPGIKRSWTQKTIIHGFLYVSYFFNFGLELTKRAKNILNGVQELRPENVILFVQLVIAILIAPSILAGLKGWLIIHSIASFYFGFVGLMASHHHPSAFHEGDESRSSPDFGLCQLDATKSRAESFAQNLLFIVSTFGQHPLHHLFPTVCHSKLYHLQPALEETLKEFSESYPKLDKIQFLIGIHLQMNREEPNCTSNTTVINAVQDKKID